MLITEEGTLIQSFFYYIQYNSLLQVFGDDLNLRLEDIQLNDLGEVGELSITKDDCLLMKGKGDQEQVKMRAEQIQDEIKNTNSDYEREKFEERLAKLVGGVAVIKVSEGESFVLER